MYRLSEIFLVFLLQPFTINLTSNSTAIFLSDFPVLSISRVFFSFHKNHSSLFYFYILSVCKVFHYIVQLQ